MENKNNSYVKIFQKEACQRIWNKQTWNETNYVQVIGVRKLLSIVDSRGKPRNEIEVQIREVPVGNLQKTKYLVIEI